ncbi:hypothetical protein D3C72_1012610 [compost metagenome]
MSCRHLPWGVGQSPTLQPKCFRYHVGHERIEPTFPDPAAGAGRPVLGGSRAGWRGPGRRGLPPLAGPAAHRRLRGGGAVRRHARPQHRRRQHDPADAGADRHGAGPGPVRTRPPAVAVMAARQPLAIVYQRGREPADLGAGCHGTPVARGVAGRGDPGRRHRGQYLAHHRAPAQERTARRGAGHGTADGHGGAEQHLRGGHRPGGHGLAPFRIRQYRRGAAASALPAGGLVPAGVGGGQARARAVRAHVRGRSLQLPGAGGAGVVHAGADARPKIVHAADADAGRRGLQAPGPPAARVAGALRQRREPADHRDGGVAGPAADGA